MASTAPVRELPPPPKGLPIIGRALEASGIAVLSNAVLRAGPVLVGGLDSSWAFGMRRGAEDLPRLMGQVTGDAPLLLMAHEPDMFDAVPARVAATFSGHTHGGQVRLMGWSPDASAPRGAFYVLVNGQIMRSRSVTPGRLRDILGRSYDSMVSSASSKPAKEGGRMSSWRWSMSSIKKKGKESSAREKESLELDRAPDEE